MHGSGHRPDGPEPRALWRGFEPVHAVTYFAPECRDGFRAIGLRRFWMGYFAGRAAPLGQVGPSVVSAIFFNFHESMVRRSIPEAWEHADCPAILRARRAAAATALRRILPSVEERALELAPLCRRVVESADGSGRPLFSANRDSESQKIPLRPCGRGVRPSVNTAETDTWSPSPPPGSTDVRRWSSLPLQRMSGHDVPREPRVVE